MAEHTVITGMAAARWAWRTPEFSRRPVFHPVGWAWRTPAFSRPVTTEAEDAVPGYRIVLARRSEFSPAGGAPAAWIPAAGYGYGTMQASRDLGIGECLEYTRIAQGSPESEQSATLRNLFGGVGDWSEQVQVLCVVSLLNAASEPAVGDFFRLEGREFIAFRVQMHSAAGEERSMTLNGVRWNGLTEKAAREVNFEAPHIS